MKSFNHKTVIITGAAMGLGLATAKVLASKGTNLVMVDYNEDALNKAKAEIISETPEIKILTVTADTSNEEQVKNYVAKTIETFGSIDGFYNNAGIEGKQAPLTEYDLTIFKKVIDINLMGVYYGLRYIIPVMVAQGKGNIVNVASVGGIRGVVNQTAYVAAKHAVAGITKNAAIEYAKNGVITNAIAPGAILTPMEAEAFKQVNPANPAAAEKEYAQRNPNRRLGKPEEVGELVAFLLSDACTYVNGQVIAIDGGESNLYGNA